MYNTFILTTYFTSGLQLYKLSRCVFVIDKCFGGDGCGSCLCWITEVAQALKYIELDSANRQTYCLF